LPGLHFKVSTSGQKQLQLNSTTEIKQRAIKGK